MWKTYLRKKMFCPLEERKELSSMSTLGVGGRAEFFVEPSKLQDVIELFKIRADSQFALHILGGGTNVVFADGELQGVVLSTRRLNSAWWKMSSTDAVLEAEAGYLLSLVVTETAKEGLGGVEFALGIPGTLGGALAGNAGAGNRSVGELLEEVTTVESDGSVKKWKRGEFGYSYRHFSLVEPGRLIAGCKMRFQRSARVDIERTTVRFRRIRLMQPHGAKSAGCAFKNPPADSAGRLLDSCGCKGLRVGGAFVSEAHANFILNAGDATGADVFRLMELCRDIVFQKTGIRLESEIKFMGFPV